MTLRETRTDYTPTNKIHANSVQKLITKKTLESELIENNGHNLDVPKDSKSYKLQHVKPINKASKRKTHQFIISMINLDSLNGKRGEKSNLLRK